MPGIIGARTTSLFKGMELLPIIPTAGFTLADTLRKVTPIQWTQFGGVAISGNIAP